MKFDVFIERCFREEIVMRLLRIARREVDERDEALELMVYVVDLEHDKLVELYEYLLPDGLCEIYRAHLSG